MASYGYFHTRTGKTCCGQRAFVTCGAGRVNRQIDARED